MNENGSSMYVDEYGYKFPTTYRHVANVPLVRGAFEETFAPEDSLSCAVEEVMPVLKYIHNDPFWKAQISEVRIKENSDILFYPEVGKMYMEFGVAENMEEKFNNLKLFFEQVANEIGWNTYKGVSVKYRGQVVAKKR
jgi:cell division protein FtsQ